MLRFTSLVPDFVSLCVRVLAEMRVLVLRVTLLTSRQNHHLFCELWSTDILFDLCICLYNPLRHLWLLCCHSQHTHGVRSKQPRYRNQLKYRSWNAFVNTQTHGLRTHETVTLAKAWGTDSVIHNRNSWDTRVKFRYTSQIHYTIPDAIFHSWT